MVSFGITIVAGAVYACCFWPFLTESTRSILAGAALDRSLLPERGTML